MMRMAGETARRMQTTVQGAFVQLQDRLGRGCPVSGQTGRLATAGSARVSVQG